MMTKSPRPISTFCFLAHWSSSSLAMASPSFCQCAPPETRDVEQHAAPHHLVLGMLDAQHVQPFGIDELGVIAVVGLVLVEDVPERIPVSCPLHAQIQRVVGVADLVPVLPAGDGVGAG